MTAPDPFRFDDGPYVLGALDEAERAAFEAHLATCSDCRERVVEVRAATGLLSRITLADVEEPVPEPDTLLPGLLRRVRRERIRRRWVTGSLGAVAAVGVVALAVLLWPTSSASDHGTAPQAFTRVRPVPVSATARVVGHGWGTEIDLKCWYAANVEQYHPYSLVVVDDQGQRHAAGDWLLAPGRSTTFVGGTAVSPADIAQLQITTEDGTVLLRLDL